MKNIYVALVFAMLIVPSSVSADSYDGPYCFEDVSMNNKDPNYGYVESSIRGTCKEVEIYNSVSLDPVLRKDYLLSTHRAIEDDCDRGGCASKSKYSEEVLIVSSSTIFQKVLKTNSDPIEVAVLDKKFFIPYLNSLFKKENITFAEYAFPAINLHILKKEEYEKMVYPNILVGGITEKDTLINNSAHYSSEKYNIYTYNYQEHGKHLYAPKGDLHESQYADFEKNKNILSNEELGIKIIFGGRSSVASVSPTSPLKKITNNWLYTKKNGKITLVWKSIEYSLDDGSVKVVGLDDKNISTTLLFGNRSLFLNTATTSSSTINSESVTDIQKNKIAEAATDHWRLTNEGKGFFQRFMNLIASWFK